MDFEQLNQYLAKLPTLTSPRPGDELYLYLVSCSDTVSSVLVREETEKQLPIYFSGKVLAEATHNYTNAEKLPFTIVSIVQKLKKYFQAYLVTVVTDQPLRQELVNPETSGQVEKWVVELSGFDVDFRPRTSIKAQDLADFLVEGVTIEESEIETTLRPLFVDRDSWQEGSGAGLLVVNPKGEEFSYALRFDFPTTNNEAEYGAIITGLKLSAQLGFRGCVS